MWTARRNPMTIRQLGHGSGTFGPFHTKLELVYHPSRTMAGQFIHFELFVGGGQMLTREVCLTCRNNHWPGKVLL